MQKIKIVSYNIHKGFDIRHAFVLPTIRENLIATGADIVFLQEVQGKLKKRREKKLKIPEEPQATYLASPQWPYFLYGKNAKYGSAHHGNALLSSYPFFSWDNINVAFAARMSRSLLHGQIHFAHTRLHVICLHFGLFKMELMQQIKILAHTIYEKIPANEPLIIAGDFNDWRHHASIHLEDEMGLQEVFKDTSGTYAKTYPAWRPTFRVDRIYYRDLKLLSGHVLTEQPWKRLSDHLPLMAEFSF